MIRKKYAITVSKNYHDELELSLNHNAKHFDKWFIITQMDDDRTKEIIKKANHSNVNIIN